MEWLLVIPTFGLVLVLGAHRMAQWYYTEAAFWRHIAVLAAAGLEPDDAPALLAWAKANEPGRWERLRGWKAPHVRRARAGQAP